MAAAAAEAAGGAAPPCGWTASEAGPAPPVLAAEPIAFVHTLCPYAERVWLALLEKGVPFHLCHIDLSDKPSWYRKINPRGLVPAVQHTDGQVYVESADICRWVDAAFEGPPLVPAAPQLRSEMEQLLSGPGSGSISAGLDLCAGSGRHWGIGTGQSAAQRAALDAQLSRLAASLHKHGGPFLLGASVTLADILVYPFIRRFAVAAPLIGYDAAAAGGGAIGAWLAAMDRRPSAAATAADRPLLLDAFKRHRSLDWFDYEPYSAFQLHPQNRHLLQR